MTRTLIAAIPAAFLLAACSAPAKADPYCPAALAALPASAPADSNTALNLIITLTQANPGTKDAALSQRILKVQVATAAVGRADGLGQASADQLAAWYSAASALRGYCK
jgi:hypothetical protein